MCAQRRRPLGRGGGEAEDGVTVAGGVGMVGKARQIETVLLDGGEGVERLPVKRRGPGRRE